MYSEKVPTLIEKYKPPFYFILLSDSAPMPYICTFVMKAHSDDLYGTLQHNKRTMIRQCKLFKVAINEVLWLLKFNKYRLAATLLPNNRIECLLRWSCSNILNIILTMSRWIKYKLNYRLHSPINNLFSYTSSKDFPYDV